jgi:hypothetical protein
MSTLTPNYSLIKPGVNDPTDQDLWGGYLNTDMDIIDTTMKTISDSVAGAQLPVGSLYMNANVSTNPATLLGYGTWAAFGTGRMLVSVGSGTDVNGVTRSFANGDTGGEYEHEQTTAELASHSHNGVVTATATNSVANAGTGTSALDGANVNGSTSSTGSGDPMDWMPPYIAVYIWKRSA